MEPVILFLDFDGVLHPEATFEDEKHFSKNELLFDFLQPYFERNQIKVVFSTAWRESFKFEELLEFMPAQAHEHIIGVTPIHESNFNKGARQREIMDYMRINGHFKKGWVALDDRLHLFEDDCETLIWCNADFGLREADIERLKIKIHEFLGA
jgi:hypothetical protein